MSYKLTNKQAGRLAREVQGLCLTAARTQLSADGERLDRLLTDVLSTSQWLDIESSAFRYMHQVKEYASNGCYALAAEDAARAAQILEARTATRGEKTITVTQRS